MVDYSEEIADTEMNGKTFTHIKVFKGSHLFDTVDGGVRRWNRQSAKNKEH